MELVKYLPKASLPSHKLDTLSSLLYLASAMSANHGTLGLSYSPCNTGHGCPRICGWSTHKARNILLLGWNIAWSSNPAGMPTCPLEVLTCSACLQAKNTLYRLSKYSLCQGCYFFASVFSITSNDPCERMFDNYPILLPQTVKHFDFDIYLPFKVR